MVARDFFEVLISNEFISMTVLKVARKSIGERVKDNKHPLFYAPPFQNPGSTTAI